MFPGQMNRHHWGFDDPAHATGTEEEQMQVFRRVRDEIRAVFESYASGRQNQAELAQTVPALAAQAYSDGHQDENKASA